MSEIRHDLTHTILSVLVIAGLLVGSLWILRPFLGAVLWATMIVVATWPVLLGLQHRLWNRRWLAVTLMTLTMLVVFVVPFVLAVGSVVGNADQIVAWANDLGSFTLPMPPAWIRDLPFVGDKLADAWGQIAQSGMEEIAAMLEPYTRDALRWLASEAGSVGMLGVQILLSVLMAAILYARGEAFRAFFRRFGRRLAGDRGEAAVVLAGQAIRAVAMGVVVTALVQSLIGGIGLAVARVPFTPVLTALMFLLAVTQIGAAPVLACAAAWLYWKGDTGWAAAMVVWTVLVSGLDNVLRPILIRQGANLPLLLIFAGVVGGLLAFGLVGLFIGPAVLAVGYTLLADWVDEVDR
jgi:predicted PurR-regulated permease PerM